MQLASAHSTMKSVAVLLWLTAAVTAVAAVSPPTSMDAVIQMDSARDAFFRITGMTDTQTPELAARLKKAAAMTDGKAKEHLFSNYLRQYVVLLEHAVDVVSSTRLDVVLDFLIHEDKQALDAYKESLTANVMMKHVSDDLRNLAATLNRWPDYKSQADLISIIANADNFVYVSSKIDKTREQLSNAWLALHVYLDGKKNTQ